jgi:formylglycine-generating enzyme required for sulfatase activity
VEAYLDHPVVGVSWTQAQAYCDWAGGRLPTEAEWEKAARGPAEGAGPKRIYPWGNKTPAADLANFNRNVGGTREVGQYPPGASPYGALDMAGNAAEWVADWFGDLYYSEASAAGINTDPPGPASGQYRVIRGGSHLSEARAIRVAYRDRNTERFQSGYIGFRCARPEP